MLLASREGIQNLSKVVPHLPCHTPSTQLWPPFFISENSTTAHEIRWSCDDFSRSDAFRALATTTESSHSYQESRNLSEAVRQQGGKEIILKHKFLAVKAMVGIFAALKFRLRVGRISQVNLLHASSPSKFQSPNELSSLDLHHRRCVHGLLFQKLLRW